MRPSRRFCLCALLAPLLISAFAGQTCGETLTIASTPPGAIVEIDGKVVGTTPYQAGYPGGYFHRPRTSLGARLDHTMAVRISKDGYYGQQITLTEGPFEWISANKRHREKYFLFTAGRFDIKLEEKVEMESYIGAGPIHPGDSPATEQPTVAESAAGTVAVSSDPSAADIYLDNKFVGQTPATLVVVPGAHHIEIRANGKVDWSRDVDLLKGSQVSLRAVLASSP